MGVIAEESIIFAYVWNFIVPVIAYVFFVILCIYKLVLSIKNHKKLKSYINVDQSYISQREKKKIKENRLPIWVTTSIIVLICVIFLSVTEWIPLGKDIPSALNKNYFEEDVYVMKDYGVQSAWRYTYDILVKSIKEDETFYINVRYIPTELKEGQVIHIQVLENSKYGGYIISS